MVTGDWWWLVAVSIGGNRIVRNLEKKQKEDSIRQKTTYSSFSCHSQRFIDFIRMFTSEFILHRMIHIRLTTDIHTYVHMNAT